MTHLADKIMSLYQRHAHAWAQARGDRLMEGQWLAKFLARVPASAAILDLGCGSGRPIARSLIERGHRLTGIDSAPQMIAMCRSAFPEQRWLVADMRTLALGMRFDGILAWDSFFHLDFEAQRRMFPIFRDHLADAGALMFTSGPEHGEAVGEFGGEPLFHASLSPAEYGELLAENGFRIVEHKANDPACGGHTVWLACRG